MIRRALRSFSRVALTGFFRRFEVAGLENVPASGPLLLVPNHTNAFVDALVVAAAVARPITITAKSTLFGHPVLRRLLKAVGAIPLHRRQDQAEGADPASNVAALAECGRSLSRGEALCIFPEGVSHSDTRLRPLRTGAARVALEFRPGPTGPLLIVPVGLCYQAKERFRSALFVRFGAPLDVAVWRDTHSTAGPRDLTAELETRIRSLTLNFRRRRDAALLQWTAEVLATRGLPPPVLQKEEGLVAERVRLAGLLNEGYERLADASSEVVGELEERVRRYHARLRRLGVAPDEVYLEMNVGSAALFVVREIETLVVGLPLALLGTVLHGPAYALTRAIVTRISRDRDHWATNAVIVGSVLELLTIGLELAAAWVFLSWPYALAATALVPYSGWYILLYRDRAGGVFRRTRTFLRFLFQRGLQRQLADEGRAIIAAIEALGRNVPDAVAQPS